MQENLGVKELYEKYLCIYYNLSTYYLLLIYINDNEERLREVAEKIVNILLPIAKRIEERYNIELDITIEKTVDFLRRIITYRKSTKAKFKDFVKIFVKLRGEEKYIQIGIRELARNILVGIIQQLIGQEIIQDIKKFPSIKVLDIIPLENYEIDELRYLHELFYEFFEIDMIEYFEKVEKIEETQESDMMFT